MSEILLNFDPYILNENNMQNYLKYKLTDTDSHENLKKPRFNNIKLDVKKSNLFLPSENDSLFWCYYIIKNSDIQYEMLKNHNTLTTRQIKIELVSKIRENKQIVKSNKFDTIINLENNLANDTNITIKTFMTLCAIDNINIIFVSKKTYYEFLTNDSNVIYIIRENINNQLKYSKNYGYEMGNEELLNEIRNNLYRLDVLDKPMKSLSSYKVSELLAIANKLAIEVLNKETGKNKTKNELYESIIQYF